MDFSRGLLTTHTVECIHYHRKILDFESFESDPLSLLGLRYLEGQFRCSPDACASCERAYPFPLFKKESDASTST